jgi:hypothetical protein
MNTLARTLLVGIPALLGSRMAQAQVQEQWSLLHDGAPMQDDFANAVAVDASGNSYVTGRSFGLSVGFPPPPPTQDIETVAYDPSGAQLWSARYDLAGGDDVAYAIAVSPQGDVYVAGQSAGYVGTTYVTQQTVIKYSATGTQLWAHQYGNTSGPNVARSMLVDASGNVFLGGTDGGTNASGDLCVRKLDPSGNVIWTATYDGFAHGYDYVYAIAFAPNGDVVAAGNAGSPSTNTTDSAVMRVSTSGTVLWEREFGLPGLNDSSFDVAVDANDIAYAAGYASTPTEGQNMSLLAYGPNGAFMWWADHDGGVNGNDVFRSVAVDPRGRIITAGGATRNGSGTDWSIYAYDVFGGTTWDEEFDGAAHLNDTARALVVDAIGNIYVAGYSNTSATTTEGVVVEYDPDGNVRFTHHYAAHPSGDQFVDMASAPGDGFVLAGYANAGSGYDYLTSSLRRTAIPYCFGDGSAAACPCGNFDVGSTHAGCSSSLGVGGKLIDGGASSLSADTLVLNGSSMPLSSCLYFQGTLTVAGGAGTTFGDGLRCAGGSTVRLGTKQNTGGASQYPASGDAPVSVRGGVTSPGVRTYQVWYRNAAPYCTPSTFNLTNGLRVTWVP